MTDVTNSTMKFGTHQFSGAAYMISGVLHLVSVLVAGQGTLMFVIGLIIIALGYLLYRGTRFVSWIVFLPSAFGVAIALLGAFSAAAWLFWLIALANFITAASCFWLIWKKP